jgi:hypothetical protein
MDSAVLSASFQDFDAHLSRLEADYVQRLEAGFDQSSEAGYAQRSEAVYATGLEAGYPKKFFLPSSLINKEGVSFL